MEKKRNTVAGCILLFGLFCFSGCSDHKGKQSELVDLATKSEHHPSISATVGNEKEATPVVTEGLPAVSDPEEDIVQGSEVTDNPVNGTEDISTTPEVSPTEPAKEPTKVTAKVNVDDISAGNYASISNDKDSWSFRREKEHIPSGTYEKFSIIDYDGYYLNKDVAEGDKVIYITFDCGYENGFTPSILATLKKHDAKAMFFVTKAYIAKNADLVIQMKEEGHMVGNHTLNHPSMPSLSVEKLTEEIVGLAELMEEKTGYNIDPFFRPPMGEYSKRTLKLTQDLGYKSIFWSIAYYDYDPEKQPGKEYVVDHFKTYHHNGAIPLIHNVSQSNTEALDDVLTYLESVGYRFGTLDELQ